jgi:hypothetical protein
MDRRTFVPHLLVHCRFPYSRPQPVVPLRIARDLCSGQVRETLRRLKLTLRE